MYVYPKCFLFINYPKNKESYKYRKSGNMRIQTNLNNLESFVTDLTE